MTRIYRSFDELPPMTPEEAARQEAVLDELTRGEFRTRKPMSGAEFVAMLESLTPEEKASLSAVLDGFHPSHSG